MIFHVFVAGEACLTRDRLPCVGGMAAGTGKGGMLVYLVKSRETWVTRLAIGHRFNFSFLDMAYFTGP